MESELRGVPPRYVPERRLGRGGAGEVWAVRDRYTARLLALKLLGRGAREGERASLIKEAIALSGLEGLGVPRVLQFGRTQPDGRLYLLRELVEGRSLQDLIGAGCEPSLALGALAQSAEQLTRLHRAELLHGDIKPANIIVSDSGGATLVDLGLAEPLRERGTAARGLTPKYAAPELLEGRPLTVRSEIHALGVALADVLSAVRLPANQQRLLQSIVERATMSEPLKRYPSADEFAAALRSAVGLPNPEREAIDRTRLWPIVGFDNTSRRLLQRVSSLQSGAVLELQGPIGSGKSVLLRRLAWSLGAEDQPVTWLDESLAHNHDAIARELSAAAEPSSFLVVDDSEALSPDNQSRLRERLEAGARVVLTCAEGLERRCPCETFEVPRLSEMTGLELIRRAMPSLGPEAAARVLVHSGRRPGPLKRVLQQVSARSVVSAQEVEALLAPDGPPDSTGASPADAAFGLLERGRFAEVREILAQHAADDSPLMRIARARYAVGVGRDQDAVDLLSSAFSDEANVSRRHQALRELWLGRAEIGCGQPHEALARLTPLSERSDPIGFEARAYRGLALLRSGQPELALEVLEAAAEAAQQAGAQRVEGIARLCVGVAHIGAERHQQALESYERALTVAGQAGDPSTVATTHSNLAVLMRRRGDLAAAIQHLEAAIDAGRRAGRDGAVRVALANLANTELYLGRLQRAQQSIDELEQSRGAMLRTEQAQLDGLQADLLSLSGERRGARAAYLRCASTYELAERPEHAAEARLECLLLASSQDSTSLDELRQTLEESGQQLAATRAHRPLLLMAQAHVSSLQGDLKGTRRHLDEALQEAKATDQREWVWRTLERRSELELRSGQKLMAHKDREAALLVLEEIASGLPPDLREVYWNDERRARLRQSLHSGWDTAYAGDHERRGEPLRDERAGRAEQKLNRILEVNRQLLGEFDLERLCARVIESALELLGAARGLVILSQPDGGLSVHASHSAGEDEARVDFSRSIARRAMASDRPVVSLDARADTKLNAFASVHQLMLQGVACVPIHGRSTKPIGGLYLELDRPSRTGLERELSTLEAFSDQVGLAIETARLVSENVQRAEELAAANSELSRAQQRLRELLGERTQKLKLARRRLRDAQHTLNAHFGYQGLVGVSAQMRRIYSLIDRLKDAAVPVLIGGESGTGKEVAAKAIHRASERGKEPFLGINCGAIPEHLLESELFGHVRGAFTGADRERKGLLREAGSGTVLLDEIGEMPSKMQAGLLRVLQERKVRPVGGAAEQPIHCRFLFATHRDLKAMVDRGDFREDLYYRIVVVQMELPPLRERSEDIPALADHFLGLFAARYKRDRKAVTKGALRALMQCPWPGNVRQLEHVLLNAWILGDSSEIDVEDLELPGRGAGLAGTARASQAEARCGPAGDGSDGEGPGDAPAAMRSDGHQAVPCEVPGTNGPAPVAADSLPPGRGAHQVSEKERIEAALAQTNWNRVKAAEALGIPRRTFYRRLKQYGLQ